MTDGGGIRRAVVPPLVLLSVMWAVTAANLLLGNGLSRYGVLPRSVDGIAGIALWPFLHAGPAHMLSNTVPMLILGTLVCLDGLRRFAAVSIGIVLMAGAGVWLLGRPAYHVGASGLIFGYFGYLIANAWYRRSPRTVIVAVVTVLLYSGLLWGLLPLEERVSFEGHLAGLVAGALAARLCHRFA